jgi:hypothetical protein
LNSGVVGAELSAELLQIKADMVLVELTDDEVDVHGLVTMNLHKAHVFCKFFQSQTRSRLGFHFSSNKHGFGVVCVIAGSTPVVQMVASNLKSRVSDVFDNRICLYSPGKVL